MQASTPVTVVDEANKVHVLCEGWRNTAASKPMGSHPITGKLQLAMDLEGRDLGNDGTIDILAIYDVEGNHTYLFDVCKMQEAAFTVGPKGEWSLKELIEVGGGAATPSDAANASAVPSADGKIVFLLFDVRMDSAALFHLYGVRLGGTRHSALGAPYGNVYDLQVAKVLAIGGAYLIGLEKTLGLKINNQDRIATAAGKKIFAPELGGSYDTWSVRPLPAALIQYCAVTIRYYGQLLTEFLSSSYGPRPEVIMTYTEGRINKQVSQKIPKMRSAHRDF